MCLRRKKGQIRLNKQRTYKEKVQDWIDKHYWQLAIVGVVIALILFVYLLLAFMPGTESGLVYNNRTGVI